MAKKTIKLKKYVDIINEYRAAAEIVPGDLVSLNALGTVDTTNGVAGALIDVMIALEDELQGRTIAEHYNILSPVQCWCMVPGEEALLNLVNTQTIVIGDYLESSGNGGVQKLTTGVAMFVALEAVTTTGSGANIKARKI